MIARRSAPESTRRALVTRPREDVTGIARALEARGFAVQVEPLLEITLRREVALPLAGVQGILATSANGVRALAANFDQRRLPVWAVGDATASCAADLGFRQVESADGDVESLARLVAGRVDPRHGALLHAAGSAVAGDLAGRLAAQGIEVRRVVLYDATAVTALSPALVGALEAASLDLALFFSPRTAATFVTLARAMDLGDALGVVTAYALSPAAAAELAALPWRRVRIAARPDQDALLAAIDADGAAKGGI
jgi:uroporphyrinogen-III synthase